MFINSITWYAIVYLKYFIVTKLGTINNKFTYIYSNRFLFIIRKLLQINLEAGTFFHILCNGEYISCHGQVDKSLGFTEAEGYVRDGVRLPI